MRFLGKARTSKVSKGPETQRDVSPKASKKNVAREIRRHKRQFDYLIIPTDEGRMFVVDASMKLEKAVQLYLRFRPNESPLSNYRMGRARYNVTSQCYELVEEGAPVQGTFPVHIIRMED